MVLECTLEGGGVVLSECTLEGGGVVNPGDGYGWGHLVTTGSPHSS